MHCRPPMGRTDGHWWPQEGGRAGISSIPKACSCEHCCVVSLYVIIFPTHSYATDYLVVAWPVSSLPECLYTIAALICHAHVYELCKELLMYDFFAHCCILKDPDHRSPGECQQPTSEVQPPCSSSHFDFLPQIGR